MKQPSRDKSLGHDHSVPSSAMLKAKVNKLDVLLITVFEVTVVYLRLLLYDLRKTEVSSQRNQRIRRQTHQLAANQSGITAIHAERVCMNINFGAGAF